MRHKLNHAKHRATGAIRKVATVALATAMAATDSLLDLAGHEATQLENEDDARREREMSILTALDTPEGPRPRAWGDR